MPRLHAERSQSLRPGSRSSTKRYSPGGSRRRNASFSSEELTVMVQTVFGAATSGGRGAQRAGGARPGRRAPTLESLAGDHDQDAARRELDQRLRERAAPPALDPAVEVLVADDDQIGADLFRLAGDLVDRVADNQLAARRASRFGEAPQPILEDRLERLALLLLELAVVHIALAADERRRGRHHLDQIPAP